MSYAHAWSTWFDVIEGGAADLSALMIELAEIDRAKDVLDIGTGLGEPAIAAARRLPKGARLTAMDSDPQMIAFARERAGRLGVGNIDFLVGNIETMSLPVGGFDAILARWSLMFVHDKPRTLRKLALALRPGGRLVAGLWCEPEKVPALALAQRTAYELFGWPMEKLVPQQAFAMADRDETVKRFKEAGLGNVSTVVCDVAYDFETPSAYVQYRLDVEDSIWGEMADKPEDDRQAVFRAIEEKLKPCLTSDGYYRVVSQAYCVAGHAVG